MKRISTLFGFFVCGTLFFASSAWSGDRLGNGGDIRRFRSTWALHYVKKTAASATALRNKPGLFPAGCTRARDLAIRGEKAFRAVEVLLRHSTLTWSASPELKTCVRVEPIAQNRVRFIFSYSRCDRDLAPQQIVYAILDEANAALKINPKMSDAFTEFGNALHSPSCLSVPPDLIQEDRIFGLGEFQVPKAFLARFLQIQERFLWKLRQPDARRVPNRLMEEVERWSVRPVSKLGQCAETELKPFAPILISPDSCGRIQNEDEFLWLLLHETAHHLGYADEAAADRFVQLFTSLDQTTNPIIRRRRPAVR